MQQIILDCGGLRQDKLRGRFPAQEAQPDPPSYSGDPISLDGTSEQSYSKYRIRGKFDQVVENMHELIRRRKARRLKTPRVEWQFIVMKQNEHEVTKAEEMARKIMSRGPVVTMVIEGPGDTYEVVRTMMGTTPDWLTFSGM